MARAMLFWALLVIVPITKPLASLRCNMIWARRGSVPCPLTRSVEKESGTVITR